MSEDYIGDAIFGRFQSESLTKDIVKKNAVHMNPTNAVDKHSALLEPLTRVRISPRLLMLMFCACACNAL